MKKLQASNFKLQGSVKLQKALFAIWGLKLGVFLVLGVWSLEFSASAAEPATQQVEFFEKHVRPTLVESCYKCHGAEKQKGGLRLDSREAILKGGDEGPVIIPGDPDKSRLIQAVRHEIEAKMPKSNKGAEKLSPAKIEALSRWVKEGAAWPTERGAKSEERGGKQHWAWTPVTKPQIPAVKNKRWTQNEIDSFVLAKLESKKMSPSKPADRRALIRRAYFDIIGLPPTFEEAEAFFVDKSPDAFTKVVDRLLASPRFGERWGRYWLDLARYSDTKGYVFEEERRYPYSYTYRDWVIQALNDDLPYDKFLLYQIAADKVVKADDPSPLAAMGFLTVGRRFLNNQPDIIDDRIDVLARGTMGLTVGCARCHDHKYDPIPTRDYYSLYGIFASSTEPKDLPLLGEPKRTEAYLAFERELQKREAAAQQFKEKRHKELVAELRKPESIAAYLMAWRDARGKSEDEIKAILKDRDLNRFMFGRWKKYLSETTTAAHAVFGPWHEFAAISDEEFTAKTPAIAARVAANSDLKRPLNTLVAAVFIGAPPATVREAAQRYGKLLGALTGEERKKYFDIIDDKGNVVTVFPQGGRSSDDEEAVSQALVANDAPLAVKVEEVDKLFRRDDGAKLRDLVKKVEEWKATSPAAPPRAMVLQDLPQQVSQRVFKRGNPSNLGDPVPPRFLEVLSKGDRPEFSNGSGRLDLAQAIASRDNPLTTRVAVNRLWLHLFGAGLVRTPSDFGTRADPPSHPDLLDWLASRLMEEGWSQKKLIRLIMLSATYQQASDENPKYQKTDPDNFLIWKQNRRRLDFEAMRDSFLAVSGKLDLAMGGAGVDLEKKPFTGRRSVYGYIERQNLPAMFRTFDFATPDAHSPQRFITTVPQQALFMMNSPFVVEQARGVAAKSKAQSPKLKVEEFYRLILARSPSKDELNPALDFINSATAPPLQNSNTSPSVWHYGYGYFDADAKKVDFTPLPHFTGEGWQGGPTLPDNKLGWVLLTAEGGHPGNDTRHAAIRRWIAPEDLIVDVKGKFEQPSPQGDGIRGYVVSSRAGELARWTIAPAKAADTTVARIEVKKGDSIDFIVDFNGALGYDNFLWEFRVKDIRNPANPNPTRWNAKADFTGAPPASLTPWEKLAQVLLLSNEFVFED